MMVCMTARRSRVLATAFVTGSAGAQVAAGMVGSTMWQTVFLLVTVLAMAAGTWEGALAFEKSTKLDWCHWPESSVAL